jgi:30S ribosomal protein S31
MACDASRKQGWNRRAGITRLRARCIGAPLKQEYSQVGKGDRKTRRGKIYRGSFGKSRPKDPSKNKNTKKKVTGKTGSSRK